MFGYVRPPLKALPEAESARFGQMYCGLCHTLGARYGQAARMILNYDFTFLAILLSDGAEPPTHSSRCYAAPIRGRAYAQPSPAMELAADESVILTYWQLRDGVLDRRGLKREKARAAAAALKPAYRRAAARRPDFDALVCKQLQTLHELEDARCASIDRAADAFAALLGGAAEAVDDPVRRRVLEQLLYHLGRWVYLVDAADDLKEDAAEGSYNVLALRYGLSGGAWTAESRREFANTLDHSIRIMAAAYELWDFGVWSPLLEETIYSGLFQVGKAVLDGTFRQTRRMRFAYTERSGKVHEQSV